MRIPQIALALLWLITAVMGQEKKAEGPTNEKAQKTYKEGFEYLHRGMINAALDAFKKADKQDGGQCVACQQLIIKYGMQLREWKAAEAAADEMIAQAKEKKDAAIAHYQFGLVLLEEGIERHKDDPLNRAHEELGKALAIAPTFPLAIFADGRTLAYLKQDEEAKARRRCRNRWQVEETGEAGAGKAGGQSSVGCVTPAPYYFRMAAGPLGFAFAGQPKAAVPT